MSTTPAAPESGTPLEGAGVAVEPTESAFHRLTRSTVIVTFAALNFGALLGGAIITESVFTLDGAGYYFLQKLNNNDLYAVMAYLLVTSVVVIVFNLIADILYGVLDPRIRYD